MKDREAINAIAEILTDYGYAQAAEELAEDIMKAIKAGKVPGVKVVTTAQWDG